MKHTIQEIIESVPNVAIYEGPTFRRYRVPSFTDNNDAYIFHGIQNIDTIELEQRYNMTLPNRILSILGEMNGLIMFDQRLAAFGLVKKISRGLSEYAVNPFSIFGYLRYNDSINAIQVGIREEVDESQSKVFLSCADDEIYFQRENRDAVKKDLNYESFFFKEVKFLCKNLYTTESKT